MSNKIVVGFGSHIPNFINYSYCKKTNKIVYLANKKSRGKKCQNSA